MRSAVQQKLEMAARVREFTRAHPSDDPQYLIVLGRFEERLARAEAIAARQQEGLVAARSARRRGAELRRTVHFELLPYLMAVGRVTGRSH